MAIKHVFFDLDNTLWDFRKNSFCALEKLFKKQNIEKEYGISFDDFYKIYDEINENYWQLFRDHRIAAKDLKYKRFSDTFQRLEIYNEELAEYFYKNYLATITENAYLVPNALDILNYLEGKYHLHILTNGFKEVTQRKVNNSELKNRFETITSAEEINIRKPNPSIFEYALKKASANKQETAFVGDDWIADAVGARDYGIYSIFLNLTNENVQDQDIAVITDLLQLKELL